MGKGWQIALGTLTAFAGLAWLLASVSSGEGSFRYYTSVAAYASDTTEGASRVHGFVLEGSIAKDLPAGHVDFAIRDADGGRLEVRLADLELPDLFRDGAEVVVEGRLEADRFVATRVLAKCPSKYEGLPEEAHPGGEA